MKKQLLKSALIALAGSGLLMTIASSGYAFTIDPTIYNGATGTTMTSWGSIVISAGGTATAKTVNGYSALGVNSPDDSVDAEIDGNEAITFNFNGGLVINDFTVSFLFLEGNFSDAVNEVSITTADASGTTFTNDYHISLQALPDTEGGFHIVGAAAGASVAVISPPLKDFAGVFTISNPFGNAKILSMTFYADHTTVGGAQDSDYAVGNINVVPEPTTMLLFGTGLLGLTGLARRKFNI